MHRLRGTDAQTIYHETYTSNFVTLKTLIYEQVDTANPVSVRELKASIIEGVRAVGDRGMAMRVIRIPWDIHHPVWVRDPDFSVEDHIYHISLPPPGGKAELCDFISQLMGTPLDSNRPLWETWIVEGLEGGQIAVVNRIHHVLADGMTSVREIIHSHSHSEPFGEVALPAVVEPIPGRLWLAATSLLELFRTYLFEFPKFYRHLQLAREASKDLKDSDSPAVGPFQSPFTFLSRPGGPYRIYRYETFPLDEIKAIGKQLDATVNTLVMGICAEALRRYFIAFDQLPALPLTVTMPVGVQGGKDALKLFNSDIQNNNLAIAFVRLDLNIADFRERLVDIRESSTAAIEHLKKTEGRRFENYFDFMPGSFIRLLNKVLKKRQARKKNPYASFGISNVPGPRETLYACHKKLKVVNILSCGNLAEIGSLNITVWSYVDKITFSFLYRKGIFIDPEKVNGYVADVVAELRQQYLV
jgi:diacylglycerol O-acyltransferase / wax synthase